MIPLWCSRGEQGGQILSAAKTSMEKEAVGLILFYGRFIIAAWPRYTTELIRHDG